MEACGSAAILAGLPFGFEPSLCGELGGFGSRDDGDAERPVAGWRRGVCAEAETSTGNEDRGIEGVVEDFYA